MLTSFRTWDGRVPRDWDVVPAGVAFSESKEFAQPDDPHLTPSQNYGVVTQDEYREITGHQLVRNSKSAANMKHVEPDDFIISMASHLSGLERSRVAGKVSGDYRVLRPNLLYSPGYLGYLMKSRDVVESLNLLTTEIRVGQRISYDRFSLLDLPLPPLKTQLVIADYLDRETAEIDALSADLEEMEALLTERRSALITAATRSLSGQTVRLGWKMNLVNGFPFDSGLFSMDPLETHLPLVRIRDITATEFETFVPASEVPDSFVVRDGDLVIGMDGDFNTVVWSRGPAALNQRVCLLRSSNRLLARYAKYFIDGQLDRINELTYATTVKHLSSGQVRNLVIPDISEDEMMKFVETVDHETAEIDAMLADITELRDLLAERRAAVIAAAVTGQIDIPTAEEPTHA